MWAGTGVVPRDGWLTTAVRAEVDKRAVCKDIILCLLRRMRWALGTHSACGRMPWGQSQCV